MVYFMQSVDGGPIKIGFSNDVDRRRAELEEVYGTPLAVLATMEGGRKEEGEVHARFSHLRLRRTEQFKPAPELLEFIGRPLLVDPNPDAVEAMPSLAKYTVIKIDAEVVFNARIAAAIKGTSLAEYVSESLRPIVERDIEAFTQSQQAKAPKPKGK